MTAVLGHHGGIVEITIFLVPAIIAIVLLRWAERRARSRHEDEGGPDAE